MKNEKRFLVNWKFLYGVNFFIYFIINLFLLP